MTDYNSILKEEKKYEEPVLIPNKKTKKFPWFKIDLICLILILIISYLVYYTTILTPNNIFLNDLKILADKYQKILNPLNLTSLTNDNYNLIGTIYLNDKNYNFKLNKNKENLNLNLNQNDLFLNYYITPDKEYIKLPNSKEQYYQLNINNSPNIIANLKTYLSNNLPKDKFIKKFYINENTPIVESNLVLTNEDLKTALNLNSQTNSYEALLTFKNNSITNDIISIKITINNLTTNERKVILYEKGNLTYKDDNQNLKFQLEEKNEDLTLKIYQNDILFSVLTGTRQESSYQYTYQVIDEIYNITLKVKHENNTYYYEISSIIEKNNTTITPTMNIELQHLDKINYENTEISNAINYETLTEEEKVQYQTILNSIIGELRQFIEQHQ
jgi:hypothetical protein